MTDVELQVAESFGRLFPVPAVAANWEDVLGRAGVARQGRPRLSRRRLRAVAFAAVVVAGALAAAAFAIVRDVFFVEPYPEGRISRMVEGVRFSLSVPPGTRTKWGRAGWENGPNGKDGTRSLLISKSLGVAGQHAQAVVFWTGFRNRTQATPCARLLGSVVDGSTAEIAAAVARAPGTRLVTGQRESPSADARHSTWCSRFARAVVASPGTSSAGETHGGVRSGAGRVRATRSACGSSRSAGHGCSSKPRPRIPTWAKTTRQSGPSSRRSSRRSRTSSDRSASTSRRVVC